MALNSFPGVAETTSVNNRVYRATASGTYTVDVKPGVYRVTRQATTNIILGGNTIAPSTTPSVVFISTATTSITFNSTASQDLVPWFTGTRVISSGMGGAQRRVYYAQGEQAFFVINNTQPPNYGLSSNGLAWVFFSNGPPGLAGAYTEELAQGPDYYVLSRQGVANGSNVTYAFSTNLRTWSSAQFYQTPGNNILANGFPAATFGDGKYVFGGTLNGNAGAIVWSSTPQNQSTWNNSGALLSAEGFSSGAYGNGVYVFVGSSGSARYSTNAITCNLANPLFGAQFIAQLRFGGGKFVAVGNTGIVSVSTNGATWTLATTGFPNTFNLRNAVYDPDEGIWAVSDPGQTSMRISTDAVTWETRSLPTIFQEYGMAYGRGVYYYGQNVVNVDQFDPRTVDSLVALSPSVPFTDTYILLDFKGQIETLA